MAPTTTPARPRRRARTDRPAAPVRGTQGPAAAGPAAPAPVVTGLAAAQLAAAGPAAPDHVAGLAKPGLAASGLAVAGLAAPEPAVAGLAAPGLAASGLAVAEPAAAEPAVVGLAAPGLAVAGLAQAGAVAAGPAGFAGGPAVVARAAPPLDPPCEETLVLRPAQPAAGMDFLPGDWLAFPGAAQPPSARPRRATPPAGGPALPPPHPAAQRFVGLCVEILNGYRPATHLRQVTHPKHCAAVTDQLTRRTVRVRMPPSYAARRGHLVRVRRMLITEPLPGVAELVAVLEQGPAVWAMAVRLERPDRPTPGLSTWLCTLVHVV